MKHKTKRAQWAKRRLRTTSACLRLCHGVVNDDMLASLILPKKERPHHCATVPPRRVLHIDGRQDLIGLAGSRNLECGSRGLKMDEQR